MIKKTFVFSLALALVACGNNSSTNTAETKKDTAAAPKAAVGQATNDLADFQFHTLVINSPSPFQIVSELPKCGETFNKALINPTEKESKYTTSTKKGLNYGVYVVDLVYLSTNEQFSMVKDYFKTSRSLAQSLGCADSFDKIAGSRIEKNIDKKDTINKVIDQIYTEMDDYLRSNDRLLSATQILVGSWIESQYITVSLIKDETMTDKNKVLYQKVSEQGNTVSKIVDLLGQFAADKEFIAIENELKNIQAVYKDVKIGSDIDKATLAKIYDKLNSARGKIVN